MTTLRSFDARNLLSQELSVAFLVRLSFVYGASVTDRFNDYFFIDWLVDDSVVSNAERKLIPKSTRKSFSSKRLLFKSL
jgi:hypothetical protein